MNRQLLLRFALTAAMAASHVLWGAGPSKLEREKAAVEKTAYTFVGWALDNKNLDSLKASVSQGDDFFMFMPDSRTTTDGYQALTKLFPAWMSPDFKATKTEIRDVKVRLAPSGKVAWFSCMLEDCGEYKGRASCWKDCRYTGVVEKRNGRWVIVQAHFSFASDKVIENYKKRLAAQPAGEKKP
jgi:ketosteroid isomerase-like protein